ncbi:ATP-binding cassette domain-containing protein, partial [Frankia sp. Cr2]|uniref:ATP-binding cassette domain-containing protein n=1 Tax=Frankia sp. Cr2 TaxID=3073932 RepID=UPI002AD59D3A
LDGPSVPDALDPAPLTGENFATLTVAALGGFHRTVLALAISRADRDDARWRRRLRERAADNLRVLTGAWSALGAVLAQADPSVPAGDPVAQATEVVGAVAETLGVPLVVPAGLAAPAGPAVSPRVGGTSDPVGAMLRASRIRGRTVTLDPSRLAGTATVMIGWTAEDGHPVALLPRRRGYRIHDPATGERRPLTEATARTLAPTALAVYRPLPAHARSLPAVIRFALAGSGPDLGVLLLAGIVAGLLALTVPLAIGLVLPRLVIDGGPGALGWLAGLLAAVVAASGLLLLVRNAAIVRLQSRLQSALEPAVWDRLLSLGAPFFTRYSTGELVARAGGIAEIRRSLSDVTVTALLGTVFALVSMVVVIAIDPGLAGLVFAGVTVLAVALVVLARRQQRHESEVFRLHGEVYGLLYPVMLGIDKIQAAGRETAVFALWARLFARQKRADAATQRLQAVATGLVAGAQPLLLTALVAGATALGMAVSVEHLLVTAVAVAQVSIALGQLGSVAGPAFAVAPILTRLTPILAAEPESDPDAADPGALAGTVDLDDVTFAYPGNSRATLDRIALRAEPGEMVAVVGPSGAGKSTIVRLLLGFETPASGHVRYDGRDLAGLDPRAVRAQIGVVTQHSRLIRGSLLDNIVGSAQGVTEDDVWQAAQTAGIADELRRLPLGLATRVGEDHQSFSGGQIQRLFIARALLRKPAILIFDEATSALDNKTQHEVTSRVAELSCTRIVIAHRLSTVRQADRIYVLDSGRVAAAGTFAELARQDGLFSRLAAGQEM